MPAESPIVLHPPAKLNLTLEVIGRRPDGYHELASIFQAIDIRDRLEILPADDLSLSCDRADLPAESNLALRAALVLREAAGVSLGARLHLSKRIPVAAGLGGGSSDAAAALFGLNRLWKIGYPRPRLAELGARVGSDVPFFLGSPTALVRGRGDVLFRLPSLRPHLAVVVKPDVAVPVDKTRRLYATLSQGDLRRGDATEAVARDLESEAELDPTLLVNSFERVAREVFPELNRVVAAFVDAEAPWIRLAGSGPCLYTLLPDDPAGRVRTEAIAGRLAASGFEVYVARTLDEPPLG
jgi:4-diphosphocytidyl-2-C-methyl-D-erythritol kinase